jgi:hypothetical protein
MLGVKHEAGMAERHLYEVALERVNQSHPYPEQEPSHAGFYGLAITGVVLVVFLGVAGIESEAVGIPLVITCALGFLGPYLYFQNQRRRYYDLVRQEYEALLEEQNAHRT